MRYSKLVVVMAWAMAACDEGGPIEAGSTDLGGAPGGAEVVPATAQGGAADVPTAMPSPCNLGQACVGEVPLQEYSPWPKFRGDMAQQSRSTAMPAGVSGKRFAFSTGKGIFSSPVVGADGTIYIGSADRNMYALNPDGTERWRVQTGEIIDSAGLLDDRGALYFGSGDGHLYAVDAATGAPLWRMAARDPSTNSSILGKALINWFEGNVAIARDGTLYAPNDNFDVYAVDRLTGKMNWRFKMNDQTWSLPAVNPQTGDLYIGNNFIMPYDVGTLFYQNAFSISSDGKERWGKSVQATIAASPMYVEPTQSPPSAPEGMVIVGGYDGILRARDARDGTELWSFPTQDHIYASPALQADGTVIQPSGDGTVYALDVKTGVLKWQFDTIEPIRSSPAIDGMGNVYFGGGDGNFYVLNANGTLRFRLKLIPGERNDLNSSPALGRDSAYIGGEDGVVHGIPYDYCLRVFDPEVVAAKARGDCFVTGEDLPEEGVTLTWFEPFGSIRPASTHRIHGRQSIAMGLLVRKSSETILALLDQPSLQVSARPHVDLSMRISGDRRFFTVEPREAWPSGEVELSISGNYLVNPSRDGLRTSGGAVGGSLSAKIGLNVTSATGTPSELLMPPSHGMQRVLELNRMAVPFPTILPSYNQIGFDSLHYLVGGVNGGTDERLAWVVGGRLTEKGQVRPDPQTKVLFPMVLRGSGGVYTLTNAGAFSVNAMNADIPFKTFRIGLKADASGLPAAPAECHVTTRCADIAVYGPFMKRLGFCNPDTDLMNIYGGYLPEDHGNISVWGHEYVRVAFRAESGNLFQKARLEVSLNNSNFREGDHAYGLLGVDAETNTPISLDYGIDTQRTYDDQGALETLSIEMKRSEMPSQVRIYFMIDTYPFAAETLIPR